MSAKSFTERQGQYLAFIDAYTRVHGRPPAETDMQPQPAFRAPDGPHAGAPRPHPPPARRRAQHRGAPRPPRLARSASPPTSQILCAEELAQGAAFAELALVDRFEDGDVTTLFRTGDDLQIEPQLGRVTIFGRANVSREWLELTQERLRKNAEG